MAPGPAAFPKLSNCNYQQWRLDMEARLRTVAALRIVKGQESRPSFTEPLDAGERRDLCDFDNRRDLAAGEIWGCVEREQQTHLEAIRDDPEAMWVKLESVHMQKRPGTCFNTYNALLSLSKLEDESLSSLSTRVSQLKSDMKALRPDDFDIAKLDDELVLMALIRALPSEYTSLRQTLLLDESLTLEKLQETFIALENQPGASPAIPILSQVASAILCGFCGRSGHSEDQCFSKRDASAKAKERASQRTQFRSGKGKPKEASKETQETTQETAAVAAVLLHT
ncbi:hypothetical protein FOMPIDRAFT_1024009 [Fomitopsis schrenkii]|uniref:DUF4219 domain-containing protein n=1 Tax=Fomitopsis schrenkii TaxID=2126942 RepID=S8E549_FOMSC|nr:hypothetical protein FOMPIDRAFT_1024009 [Fomitopsis schrenkii]